MRYKSATEAYIERLKLLIKIPLNLAIPVRGIEVLEEPKPTIITLVDPTNNVVRLKGRNLNYAFMIRELLWYMSGDAKLKPLKFYNPKMAEYSDDGIYLDGAYGKWITPQLPWLLRKLTEEHTTRQAVIQILPPCFGPSKDVPCTLSLHFQIRSEQLSLTTHMRSEDTYMGLPYDLFSFTSIQQLIAAKLGIKLGTYHHIVNNLHLYATDLKAASQFKCIIPQIKSSEGNLPVFGTLDLEWVTYTSAFEQVFELSTSKVIDMFADLSALGVSWHLLSMWLVLYLKFTEITYGLDERHKLIRDLDKNWSHLHMIIDANVPFSFLLKRYLKTSEV